MKDFQLILNEFSKLKNKKIITVTLNPVIDRTLWVQDFIAGKTMKVDKVKILAAGKGVNVSRALKTLDIPSTATGILPKNGSTYYLSLLKSESIDSDFFIADANETVRSNITILSNTIKGETHLREKGPTLNRDILNQFKNKLKKLSYEAEAVIFSGSIPSGLPENSYEELIKSINIISKITALDSSGPALKLGIKVLPSLIKPNENESKDTLGFIPDSKNNILKAMNNFNKMGINHVILSLGDKGLVYSNGNNTVKANVRLSKIVNSVGSGDASLAGGLAAILAGLTLEEIAAFSCAMGAANTLSYGACIIDILDLKNIYQKVNLEHI